MQFKVNFLCVSITSLLVMSTATAMQSVTSCEFSGGIYHCNTIYSFGHDTYEMDFYQTWYNQYRPNINLIFGNPYPTVLTNADIENELANQMDKTPWSMETVADYIANLSKAKLLLNYILISYNLSPEMALRLGASLTQLNTLIDGINGTLQVSNHLINQEWGYAGSELATVLTGFVIAAGVASYPITVTSAALLLAGIWVLPQMESFLDAELEEYNHVDFLEIINQRFQINNIFILPPDTGGIVCSTIPAHKVDLYPECWTPPIVLDLDGNGIDFIPLSKSKTQFDVNNDKALDNLSWPTKGNGVLFADWNNSGVLDMRNEFVFSLFSPRKGASDLEGLRTFDYQDDGKIDSNDRIYERLYLWDDINEDGISTADEITSLSAFGITLNIGTKDKNQSNNVWVGENKIDKAFYFRYTNLGAYTTKGSINTGLGYSVQLNTRLN